MTRSRPRTRALIGLVLVAAIGGTACRKAKPPAGDKPDQPIDPGIVVLPGKGGDGTPPTGGPVRPALPDGWREFKHPEGAYQIYVPAQPIRPKQSAPSLKLKQPLQPNEGRESIHEVHAAAKQPFTCTLELQVFHPSVRVAYSAFEPGAAPSPVPANWTVRSRRTVTWGGLTATELVVEKSFPGHQPDRAYMVGRSALTPDRLYQFLLERTDRMPTDAERAAFFDSFVPGS